MFKNITLQEIADYAHVSIATVSRMMNNPKSVRESTRKKITTAMNELGFTKSSINILDSQSPNIIIIVQGFNNIFDMELINSTLETAYSYNYNVLVVATKNNYTTYDDFERLFQTISVAGIILHTGIVDPELTKELQLHYPVVMCSNYVEDLDISYVGIDDIQAAKTATEYLISSGHKKIALINCNPAFLYSRRREAGYRQALEKAGLTVDPSWILSLQTPSYSLALSFAKQLLNSLQRPDAIFACSDIYGIAALNAALQLGLRVPEDVSIISFDNTSIAGMTTPSLTTVAQPIAQLGARACELLIERINNNSSINQHIILDAELIIRNSTSSNI